MDIIPVIDLLDGQVVHARMGQRHLYQPIKSQLCASSNPLDIVSALIKLHPFKRLYIADLNSIQNTHSTQVNINAIKSITLAFPQLEIWLDAGINTTDSFDKWQFINTKLILGSESFSHINNYLAIVNDLDSDYILSLDFIHDHYQGAPELLEKTTYWPQKVIIMSLNNVGKNTGANVNLLRQILKKSTAHDIYTAGGVRNINDIIQLNNMRITGALVATSLHNKQLSPSDITLAQHL